MTEAMPFLQKYDITFLRPTAIPHGLFREGSTTNFLPLLIRPRREATASAAGNSSTEYGYIRIYTTKRKG